MSAIVSNCARISSKGRSRSSVVTTVRVATQSNAPQPGGFSRTRRRQIDTRRGEITLGGPCCHGASMFFRARGPTYSRDRGPPESTCNRPCSKCSPLRPHRDIFGEFQRGGLQFGTPPATAPAPTAKPGHALARPGRTAPFRNHPLVVQATPLLSCRSSAAADDLVRSGAGVLRVAPVRAEH